MSYYYSQEARVRISAFEQQYLTDFIEEVPHSYRKSAYNRLSAIDGFRSGSPADFKAKQKRLISHLLHPQGGAKGEADWKTFANFWVAWARHHLDSDFPAGDKLLPANDAGPLFLTGLAERFPDAPRETVERLIVFSGFADHDESQTVLGKFRPASTVARDRLLDALPKRVDTIEDSIKILQADTEQAAETIESLRSKIENLMQDVGDVSERAAQSTNDLFELHAMADHLLAADERLVSTLRALQENAQRADAAAEAADGNARSLREAVEVLAGRADGWDEAAAHLGAIEDQLGAITAREKTWLGTTEAVAGLSDRLEALQSNLGRVRNSTAPTSQVRLFEAEAQGPVVEIRSVETACELISINLQACGIVKGAAQTVARQALAALAAGQLIQFSGSLADMATDAAAAAVGGLIYHEWRVPVGLVSDEAAAECLDMVGDTSGCLALKGANRSAFEVYGYAVRDAITRRQLGMPAYPRLALIASWAQGPAAFPDGGTLAELGPVFDTDALPMRGVTSRTLSLKYGHLTCDAWDQLEGFASDISGSLVSELKALFEEAHFQPGNLWTRCAERAYLRLRASLGASETEDLHAMLKHWALPWAKATGCPIDDLTRVAEQVMSQHQVETSGFEGA
ncbi:hypothetical protein ACEK06_14405 [Pseudomonas brenneri]|jgi:hypothetical protein|uniref:Uncharacterized protein n=1 Tax=Pseudomonas reactans TaxID=117680 RepID=A0A7Y8KG10_9PSED|nr:MULTISPECIES: hypothetical protein [Pseudomonas]VVN83227.1 hypothetical protein PS708_01273 [Pseudomonas fluorescens]AJP52374.1 hypothetical protein PF1751_v1c26740 [Pseudomonas simiae]MCT8950670.1 hypothetical protein [Pseudomonas iridis]MQU00013.1 hypothetical protein [Pseudomonas sp. FSL R10-2245]NNA35014.1 hypothetical protein [Pseudomonas lundensis]